MHSSVVKLLRGSATALFNGIFSSLPAAESLGEDVKRCKKSKSVSPFSWKCNLSYKSAVRLGPHYVNNAELLQQ